MENDFVARRKLLVLLFATTIKMPAAGKLEFIKNVISDKVVSIDGVIDNLAQYYPIDDPEAHREYVRALDVTNKTVFKHGGVAATAKMQLDYILDTLSELYNRRDLEGYNKSDAACHYIYRTLKDYLQLNTREVRCWHMHPIGDRWISDDCLTMVHTVMCLPRHVFNDTIKLSLMGIALRPDVASFDSFLMLASSLVNSSAIQQWMHSTQLLVPIGEMDTRRNIRCAPRPVKIADLAQYLARESYSTNATNRETAQAVIDEIPLRTNLHASELHIWVSEFQKYEQSQKKTNQSTTKEEHMPIITPDYTIRCRLVTAALRSTLNITTIATLLSTLALNDLDTEEQLFHHLKTFDSVTGTGNVIDTFHRVYAQTPTISTRVECAELLTQIQKFATAAGSENMHVAKFLELHHAYLGVSQAVLDVLKEQQVPALDPKARELLLLWLENNFPLTVRLLNDSIMKNPQTGLVAEFGDVEKMRQYLVNGTGVCLWNGGNGPVPMLRYAHSRVEDAIVHIFSSELPKYKSSIDDTTTQLLVEIIKRMLADRPYDVAIYIAEKAVSEPLRAAPQGGMYIGLGVKQQGLLGEGCAQPLAGMRTLGETFGSPGPMAFVPAGKPFNVVPDLKKVLGTYQGVTCSDDMYSVVLKMFSVSPGAAIQALLELDVLAKELALSEEQHPKALMHIFSKRPQPQSVNIPKTPEGSLQEQVEFVLYWTLLAGHLNGRPVQLKPSELATVFKYVTSEHYRTTLIHII